MADQAPPQNFTGEQTGRRHRPDVPAEQTGTRPRPGFPPPGEQTGTRPRPDATGMQRRPVPGERRPGDTGPRRLAPGDAPSSNGIQRPQPPGDATANGMPRPPVDPRRMPPGDAPSSNGIPRRPAPNGVPEANGMPSGTIRRPDANGAPPRRLAPGDAPSSNGIPRDATANGMLRPPAPGEAPERRPMTPNADMTGRHPMPSRAESSGPRPMPPRAESSGPRPMPGGPAISSRLGGGPGAPGAPAGPAAPGAPAPAGPAATGAPAKPEEPPADAPSPEATQIAAAVGVAKVEKREEMDPTCLTTEMEAIGEDVKKRREVDHTLARFSAVHDELLEQERQRKERRAKLMPWVKDDDELDEATQFADPVTLGESEEDDEQKVVGRTPQQRRLMRAARIGAIAAAAVVFASTGVAWTATQWADSKIQKIDALGGNSQAVHQAEKQLGDENFLLVGSDTRAGAKAGDNVGTQATEGGARSDVIMLAHIPADRKRMVVTSLPRDVRVDRPACRQWNPDNGQYGGPLAPEKEVMANSIYNDGGPECVTNMMTQLSGLKINHFVSIDFVGFREMSTAIGGVQICTPKAIKDDKLGVILDKPGKYTLKGDQALQYVRARTVAGDVGGDFDRIKRQQGFLSAMLRQALSNEVLLSPSKLNNFINALTKSTVGDNIDVASLLELANSLQSLDAGRVSFVTIPHWTDEGPTKSNDDNIERLRDEDVKKLFQTIIDGTPLPQEKPTEQTPGDPNTPAKPGSVIDPKQVTIQVLNGDPAGNRAANLAANALQQKGFKISNRGEATEKGAKTTIKFAKGREDWAATLKAAVPSADMVEAPEMGGAVVLTIGSGFDEQIQTPQPGTQAQGQNANQNQTTGKLDVVNAAEDPCAK
ncbi:LCP family protein [Lentzea nigeriaca]|uniref:LCP family protein n=1 Tax=Lentzea nigeriaca TaxID=1128665 RepID=UPI00195DBEA9|nr:LCP family protein [Lentzea nigeriaca]MBM7861309.1 LCP family protein required for cell wall assembly [Lentzea nigeriaca]